LSGLRVVVVRSSVVVVGNRGFPQCDSLVSRSGSRPEQIESSVFALSGLKSSAIPSSPVVLSEGSFRHYPSLETRVLESGSPLERDAELIFPTGALESIPTTTGAW
jgi:hypothetical protein